MKRTMFKSKIHRATVTHADLHVVGSVTVDLDLLEVAGILPGELISHAEMETAEARAYIPRVVHVDQANAIRALGTDPSEAVAEAWARPPHAIAGTSADF